MGTDETSGNVAEIGLISNAPAVCLAPITAAERLQMITEVTFWGRAAIPQRWDVESGNQLAFFFV